MSCIRIAIAGLAAAFALGAANGATAAERGSRKGDYVIELGGTWTVDSYRDARAAIKAFDQLTFGP